MTASAIVAICNRALSEMGTQKQIADLTSNTPASVQCALWYDNTRQGLLRAAPWGFAREQGALSLLGSYQDLTSPWPWLYKYAYPSTCIKLRYVIPSPEVSNDAGSPQVDVGPAGPLWAMPSRSARFLISNDDDGDGNRIKTIITNVENAIGVWTRDEDNPDLFDALFDTALTSALSYKLVIPLSGNVGQRNDFKQSAKEAIQEARAADGNEAIPTSDHTVDWIAARGTGTTYGYGAGSAWGSWYSGYDANEWGM